LSEIHKYIGDVASSNDAVKSNINLLLVEDNLPDARLVEIYLSESEFGNCKITRAVSLNEAITQYNTTKEFDVVLLDLSLPDSTGFETLEKFLKATNGANVIILTGFSDKRLGINALKVGAQDYLVKGEFQAEELAKVLRYSIERKTVLVKLAESQKAQQVAEESAKMKEKFLASISHEMRTPMNAIYGMSNLLSESELDNDQNSMVESIKQSSRILLGIINDILEISQLQNGKIDFQNKPFDIFELMAKLMKILEYNKNDKPIELLLNIDSSVPKHLLGDELRLNQILLNLVGNAIKFTDHGSVKVNLSATKVDVIAYKIHFEIIDTGIGIATEKLGDVFENFARINTKDRIFEGTGLGLSIVKNLIEQQDGSIKVDSSIGQGSVFSFNLIFQQNLEFTPEEIVIFKHEDEEKYQETKFHILIVEDNIMNQIVAKKTLEVKFRNIVVDIVDDGQKCIDFLEKQSTNLILMDIQMPVMDGYEAINIIRNALNLKDLKVLAMTAHANVSKDEKILRLGFDDFVLKPFEPEDLKNKVIKYVFG
jgi:signal transduction histidine kinase